jgi:hypothetical protein
MDVTYFSFVVGCSGKIGKAMCGVVEYSVVGARIFLGLPDPLVTSSDPAPDPSVIEQKYVF